MTIAAATQLHRTGLYDLLGKPVPLLGVTVQAEVIAGHARATVRQRYRNDEAGPVEAIYVFPLPTRAVLTGFTMTVAGRRLTGEVHEREEAFARYDEAIATGHGAALLEQERANVFTATVGNLLPGEETVIEIEYLEPVQAEEGGVRWSVPALVAPRYVPGAATGDRSAHGVAEPTDRVPDADRISPPIAAVRYGLALELVFDLGCELDIDSPSHDVVVERLGTRTRVSFARAEVPLDRDVVVTAVPRAEMARTAPIAAVLAHRGGAGKGHFALSVVPDLRAGLQKRELRGDVVFVLDRSGSMGGASIEQARLALRLCLRQLREGDRFGILAFDDRIEAFASELVPFTQKTLTRADAWLERVSPRGGTELLAPLLRAVALAPGGIIVVLTDGQVANEDEIERAVAERAGGSRFYSFGIGTNVSDALLVALAERTGGAVEMIHPGERIDDKVVAQFARALAPRVTDLRITFHGVEVAELAPAEPRELVDGEPFTLFGVYETAGQGTVQLRGTCDREAFFLELPVCLPERDDSRPGLPRLWARERIRELERSVLDGRRARTTRERIIKLSREYGVASRYTSFVVVEERSGDRRTSKQPAARIVPVHAPAGWDLFDAGARSRFAPASLPAPMGLAAPAGVPMSLAAPAGVPMSLAAPAGDVSDLVAHQTGFPPGDMLDPHSGLERGAAAPGGKGKSAPSSLARRALSALGRAGRGTGAMSALDGAAAPAPGRPAARESADFDHAAPSGPPDQADEVRSLLAEQAASGLWEVRGKEAVRATTDALLVLLRAGVTAAHRVYGAQLRKAIDALLAAIDGDQGLEPRLVELALAVAWLATSGKRSRRVIEDRGRDRAALGAVLGDETAVWRHVERLAATS
jgi:Ca-activated chloride channel family protein